MNPQLDQARELLLAMQNHIPVPAAQDVLLRLSPYAVEFRYLGAKAPTVTPTP